MLSCFQPSLRNLSIRAHEALFSALSQAAPSSRNLTFVSCKDEEISEPSSSILNVAQTREDIPAFFQEACRRLLAHPASCFAATVVLALHVLLYLPFACRVVEVYALLKYCVAHQLRQLTACTLVSFFRLVPLSVFV